MANTNSYFDRKRLPRETIDLVRPHLASLGITRLARQTGLDRIGIPCFSAIRPNARTLATNQGKGVSDDDALASAVMEAIEFAISENPSCSIEVATCAALLDKGHRVHLPHRLMPTGEVLDQNLELPWARGHCLFSNELIMAPLEAAIIGNKFPDLTTIARSTNGLASGNCREEAVFHALCELIERDASSLWSLLDDTNARVSAVDPKAFDDPIVDSLAKKIADAGLELLLFDQTSDLGVPVISAHIFEPESRARLHFDQAEGCGCHPVPARAAIRAITEAAQTRITNIAGARDDFSPSDYNLVLQDELRLFRDASGHDNSPPPAGCKLGSSLEDATIFLIEKLKSADINEVVVVPLGGEHMGISVVKVLAPDLEDMTSNLNWRPGRRVLQFMGLAA